MSTLPSRSARRKSDHPLRPFTEYRVQFRRERWSASTSTKVKRFPTLAAAHAFEAKLLGGGRPELSRPSFILLEKRAGFRTRWVEFRPRARQQLRGRRESGAQ